MKLITFVIVLLYSYSTNSKILDSVEHYFKESLFENIKISPDGSKLAFSYNKEEFSVIGIIDRKTNKAKSFKYREDDKILDFHWANNERILLEVAKIVGFLDSKGGALTLHGINFNGKKRKMLYQPQFASYRIVNMLKDDKSHILIQTNHYGDKGLLKLSKLNIYNGKLNYQGGLPKDGLDYVITDNKGNPRIGYTYKETEDTKYGQGLYKLFYKNINKDKWIEKNIDGYRTGDTYVPILLTPDGESVYISSNINKNKTSLYKYNFKTENSVEIFNNKLVEHSSFELGNDDELIGINFDPDFSQIIFINPEHEDTKLLKSLYKTFNDSKVSIINYSEDNQNAVIYVSSDKNPGEFFLFNKKDNRLDYIASSKPWIKQSQMLDRVPVKYKTRDNIEIHGYLTLPKHKTKNLPTIILPHGGPHGSYARDKWDFNPEAQFLSHHGYAVMQMNYRGSGGYGDIFESKGYKKWGTDIQNDITDATHWLINEGIANPEKICIYGASFGGYSALEGVVREPDLYKCAIGYAGIYDLEVWKKKSDIAKRRYVANYQDFVLGTDEVKLKSDSPANHVSKIKADLFIAHGTEDVRVPISQYDVIKKKLDEIGKPFKSMIRNEGHGFVKDENKYEFYKEMLMFFNKNIGSK